MRREEGRRRKEGEDCGCAEKTRTPLRKWGIMLTTTNVPGTTTWYGISTN